MVNDRGQLYTIEGIAAGMIMLFTTYLVLGATSVYTPGDSHISDMQLEQTGTDALQMMNTPANGTSESQLQQIVENNEGNTFNTVFLDYVNNKTGSKADNLHYTASVTYYDILNKTTVTLPPFAFNRNLSGVEHPVRVTELVIANKQFPGGSGTPRAVLVEVLLWRD
ncbi:hypothetical protein Mboo_0131 [Methanoregula boonei 6A8]|jgi:hypothetical protein|uniref:Uncharacterized protein n=1 Tax=Methanoregula boonei (strain DSM 21154 / JCM 14090 / 6A8) TaxID=456442 RepID=A7I4J4_METB6|nr:hypothetical protein [Methanoregula boonei]ABS54655.1 hypothetical protein Mboo_0131 [Methanoregula boonei 6A8]